MFTVRAKPKQEEGVHNAVYPEHTDSEKPNESNYLLRVQILFLSKESNGDKPGVLSEPLGAAQHT